VKGGPKTFLNWASENLSKEAFKHLENVVGYQGRSDKFVARADGIWDLGNQLNVFAPIEKLVSLRKNAPLKRCLLDASGIIYQSDFSKISCEEKWPDLKSKPSTIIVNPLASGRLGHVKWTGNKRSDEINIIMYHRHTPMKLSYLGIEFIEFLQRYTDRIIKLHIIGTIPKPIQHWYRRSKASINCTVTEINAFEEFSACVQSCDFVLNLAHFDPCPNVILECATIGVPVLAVKSGGIPDLLGNQYPFYLDPFVSQKSWLVKNTVTPAALSQFRELSEKLLQIKTDHDIYSHTLYNSNEARIARLYEEFILLYC
jgi:glycosyltransferase involved in cell wall biosynthesis